VFYVSNTTNKRLKVRESSEDSNEGGRESDTLTKALRTKEQQGRVHAVSRKLTWKEGFSAHKSTYQKQKNDLDTNGWHGAAEKKATKGDSRRLEAYTRVSRNTILWYYWDDERRRA
jgi:hypothetical protein